MGHSVTMYKEKGIICRDSKIEIWFRFIGKEIEKMENPPTWLMEAKEYWKEYVYDYVIGCIDVRLDEFLTNREKELLFIKICEGVYNELRQFKPKIPKEIINTLAGYKEPFAVMHDIEAKPYLSYGRALIRLIKGRQEKEILYI